MSQPCPECGRPAALFLCTACTVRLTEAVAGITATRRAAMTDRHHRIQTDLDTLFEEAEELGRLRALLDEHRQPIIKDLGHDGANRDETDAEVIERLAAEHALFPHLTSFAFSVMDAAGVAATGFETVSEGWLRECLIVVKHNLQCEKPEPTERWVPLVVAMADGGIGPLTGRRLRYADKTRVWAWGEHVAVLSGVVGDGRIKAAVSSDMGPSHGIAQADDLEVLL